MFGQAKKQPRLCQWDGRRHSSRSDHLTTLAHLQQPRTVIRLAVVLVTVIAATCLAYFGGAPCPYRVGEICPGALRARVSFQVVNQSARAREKENERLSIERQEAPEPDECRVSDPPVIENYPQGTPLVPRGQPITE